MILFLPPGRAVRLKKNIMGSFVRNFLIGWTDRDTELCPFQPGCRFREQQAEEQSEQKARAIIRNDMAKEVAYAKSEYYRLRRIGENRTPEQQERFENIADWYRTEYAPAWEEILYNLEDGNLETAKRIAKGIRVYD